MSGSVSPPAPSTLGTLPKEGSKIVSLSYTPATAQSPFVINLLSQFQTGRFTTCQGLIVDNSTNGFGLVVTCLETGEQIPVPPFTFGRYPLLCGPAPEFSIVPSSTTPLGWGGTVRMFFTNIPGGLYETRVAPTPGCFSNAFFAPNPTLPTVLKPGTPGSNLLYAITSIDLTLAASGAIGAATNGQILIYEQATQGLPNTGGSYAPIWGCQYTAPVTAAGGVFLQRQVTFPTRIMQHTPDNPVWFLVTGTANPIASLNLTFETSIVL